MFQAAWDTIIQDEFCSSLVRHGVVPNTAGVSPPPRHPRRQRVPSSPSPSQRAQLELVRALHEDRVVEALASGVPPPDCSPCSASMWMPGYVHPWFSTYFLVPKPTPGEYCGIMDLRGVNDFVQDAHFKQETLRTVKETVWRGDFLTSVDISSAYPHLLVSPRFRNLFCFRTDLPVPLSVPQTTDPARWTSAAAEVVGSSSSVPSSCRDFRFRGLPFGLKSAPRIWTRFLRPVASALCQGSSDRPGIRIVVYLDDMLIMSPTWEGCHRDTVTVVNLLRSLGLLLNEKKCETVPSQTLEFLGLILSTRDMMFFVPGKKRRAFLADTCCLLHLSRQRLVWLRQLVGWIGKARAFMDAVVHSRRRTRSCLRCMNLQLTLGSHWDARIPLSSEVLSELQWWLRTAAAWRGNGILIPDHDLTIDTDARPWAWGGFLRGQHVGGFWSSWQLKHLSQNHKELLGVYYTLQGFEPELTGKTVLVQTDNKSVISYLMKGSGRSSSLSRRAEEVFDWCFARQIRLRCVHLKGVLNVRADRVSRWYESRSDYQLRPSVFRQLQRRWGRHDMDLFADRHNHQTPRYFSLLQDSAAAGQDAFQQDGSQLVNPFANPPFALMSQVLRQIRRQQVRQITVIAPSWGAAWLPDLQSLAVCPPVPLVDTVSAPLMMPVLPTPWPALLPQWTTCAWRLSGLS